MNLSQLSPGKSATIDFSASKSPLLPRLTDMGISEATPVTCLFKSFSGGMKAYRFGMSTIALRMDDASFINILNSEVLQ